MIKKVRCAYCGSKAETDDHVPPKSFFPKPRPSNLVTVPSCKCCNEGAGKDEEFFLATFMFSGAGVSSVGQQLWKEKLHRMYEKNPGLRRKIAEHLSYKDVYTPAGLYLGKHMTIKTDEARFERVVNKIVRGLYFYEYDEPLGIDTQLMTLFLNTEEKLEAAMRHINQLSFGKRRWQRVFEYRCGRLPNDNKQSVWVTRFYGQQHFWSISGDDSTIQEKD